MRDALTRMDAALMDMRRLWSPTTSGRTARNAAPAIDLSTVLVVHVVGDDEDGLGIAQVGERLGVAAATASRLCDRAIAAGYLDKRQVPGDARRRALVLTTAGVELRRESLAFRRDYLAQILADWSAEEILQFERHLSRFAAAVAATPPQTRVDALSEEGR